MGADQDERHGASFERVGDFSKFFGQQVGKSTHGHFCGEFVQQWVAYRRTAAINAGASRSGLSSPLAVRPGCTGA